MENACEVMRDAHMMCEKNYNHIRKHRGLLRPTKNDNPLYPPWIIEEYQEMEKDRGKYYLYFAAIEKALEHLLKEVGYTEEIDMMVVGAGGGRLVDYCYKIKRRFSIKGRIHVVEVNQEANERLKIRYQDEKEDIIVHPYLPIRTSEEIKLGVEKEICGKVMAELIVKKSIRLFVSELFGSFADNEFVSEILSASVNLFGHKNCISVPQCYSLYTCPIQSNHLDNHFNEKKEPCSPYILGMPDDAKYLTDIVCIYSASTTIKKQCITGEVKIDLKKIKSKFSDAVISLSGFAFFFTAELFDDIQIDTRPGVTKNTYFWESGFLTIDDSAKKKWLEAFNCSNAHCAFKIERFCERVKNDFVDCSKLLSIVHPVLKTWYVWTLKISTNHQNEEEFVHNKDSLNHCLLL